MDRPAFAETEHAAAARQMERKATQTILYTTLQVLQRLSALLQLDGCAVTAAERAAAAESLRREAVVLALMASSSCLAHKLVNSLWPYRFTHRL